MSVSHTCISSRYADKQVARLTPSTASLPVLELEKLWDELHQPPRYSHRWIGLASGAAVSLGVKGSD